MRARADLHHGYIPLSGSKALISLAIKLKLPTSRSRLNGPKPAEEGRMMRSNFLARQSAKIRERGRLSLIGCNDQVEIVLRAFSGELKADSIAVMHNTAFFQRCGRVSSSA
jgi:hypothetical protein